MRTYPERCRPVRADKYYSLLLSRRPETDYRSPGGSPEPTQNSSARIKHTRRRRTYLMKLPPVTYPDRMTVDRSQPARFDPIKKGSLGSTKQYYTLLPRIEKGKLVGPFSGKVPPGFGPESVNSAMSLAPHKAAWEGASPDPCRCDFDRRCSGTSFNAQLI